MIDGKNSMDISFCPYDDISFHNTEKNKDGVRAVLVMPNGYVKTIYAKRTYLFLKECLDGGNEKLSGYNTETVGYVSNGEQVFLSVIYLNSGTYQPACVLLNDKPLIYAKSCLIVGDDFKDLTMNQCYALVTSARAMTIDGQRGVCVNIRDNMELVPRLITDEE